MNLAKLIEFLRDRLKTVVLVCYAVLALVVVLDAIPAVVDKEHAHTSIEHWPGFWAVFGFVACVGIIIVSKWFGHAGIMVREDYYEDAAAETDGSGALNGSKAAGPEHGHTPKGHHE